MIDVQLNVFEGVPIHVSDKSQEQRIIAVDFRAGQAQMLLSIEKASELIKKVGIELARQKMLLVGQKFTEWAADKDWIEAIIGVDHKLDCQHIEIFVVTTLKEDRKGLMEIAKQTVALSDQYSQQYDCKVHFNLHYSGFDPDHGSPHPLGYEHHYFFERPTAVEESATAIAEACHQ